LASLLVLLSDVYRKQHLRLMEGVQLLRQAFGKMLLRLPFCQAGMG
jgi:hypothetical protein